MADGEYMWLTVGTPVPGTGPADQSSDQTLGDKPEPEKEQEKKEPETKEPVDES